MPAGVTNVLHGGGDGVVGELLWMTGVCPRPWSSAAMRAGMKLAGVPARGGGFL